MKFIKIYYGMSGSFKATTITADLKKGLEGMTLPMWSEIKPWKKYENTIFSGLISDPSDLNLAMLHLIRLKDFVYGTHLGCFDTLLVERGVSDMIFYWNRKEHSDKFEEVLGNAINAEFLICEQNSYYCPEKILLVQKDVDFIKNVILKDPFRAECFPGGVQDYLDAQDDYVKFTKECNQITQIINIKDAKRYITEDLGMEFKI